MTLRNFSQNSMTFPEFPENFKIPEIPWLFHDRCNPEKPVQLSFCWELHNYSLKGYQTYASCRITSDRLIHVAELADTVVHIGYQEKQQIKDVPYIFRVRVVDSIGSVNYISMYTVAFVKIFQFLFNFPHCVFLVQSHPAYSILFNWHLLSPVKASSEMNVFPNITLLLFGSNARHNRNKAISKLPAIKKNIFFPWIYLYINVHVYAAGAYHISSKYWYLIARAISWRLTISIAQTK